MKEVQIKLMNWGLKRHENFLSFFSFFFSHNNNNKINIDKGKTTKEKSTDKKNVKPNKVSFLFSYTSTFFSPHFILFSALLLSIKNWNEKKIDRLKQMFDAVQIKEIRRKENVENEKRKYKENE